MTEIEKLALRISKQKNSCKKCVYNDGSWCNYPHSDAYIIENKTDACFEGVYQFIINEKR